MNRFCKDNGRGKQGVGGGGGGGKGRGGGGGGGAGGVTMMTECRYANGLNKRQSGELSTRSSV